MIDRPKSRDALVLDALEAELGPNVVPAASADSRQGARPGFGASEDARLAELARIVGQNDRFRDLLRVPSDGVRHAPAHEEQSPQWDAQPAPYEGAAQLNAYVSAHRADAAGHSAQTPAYAGDDPSGGWDAQQHGYRQASVDARSGNFSGHVAGAYASPEAAWNDGPTGQYDAQYAGDQSGGYASGKAQGQGQSQGQSQGNNLGQNYSQDYGQDYGQGYGGDQLRAPDPLQAIEGNRLRRRPPSRRPLYAAAAVIALCVSASAGYFTLRGPGVETGGEAALIKADATPVKVKPPADNAATPAATKEIYEQLAKPSGNTKVVANNEQPVDVEQTLRQQRAAAVASGKLPSEVGEQAGTFGAAGLEPLPTHAANRDPRSGLGEPRKVRTVSIGPDGKVREAGQQVAAAPAAAVRPPSSTPVASSTPVPAPAPKIVAKQEHRVPSTAVDVTTTGSVGSAASAPAVKPKSVVAAAAPAAVSRGGFAVQLGAPGSEQEAKTLAASLKRKYAALSSHNTAVIKAQANGRTIYRLRVPGLSRDSANSLCQQLKSVGGNCFVAQG